MTAMAPATLGGMSPDDFNILWPPDAPLLFTSVWGWTPETWGMLGWTQESHRESRLAQLPDPFICVQYCTGHPTAPVYMRGKIVGVLLATVLFLVVGLPLLVVALPVGIVVFVVAIPLLIIGAVFCGGMALFGFA